MTDPCQRCADPKWNHKGPCGKPAKFKIQSERGPIYLCGTHKNQRVGNAALWGYKINVESL